MNNRVFTLVLMLSLLACCIEVEVSLPGFPEMAHAFNADEMYIQLTLIFNMVGFSVGALIYGPLSDSFGRRPVMLIGNLILLIGATACALAPNLHFLYFARFIQGIGAATSAVVVFAMVADQFQGTQSIKILSLFNAIFTICMAGSPLLGSFINFMIGWRGNYALIAVLTHVAWVALVLFLPETHKVSKKITVNSIIADYKFLLGKSDFIKLSLAPSLLYTSYIVFISFSAFLYRETYQLSLLVFSLHMLFIITCFAVCSLLNAKLLTIVSTLTALNIGQFMCRVSSILLLISALLKMPIIMITLSMGILSLGSAISYPILFNHSLELYPDLKGGATSLIMTMRTLTIAAFLAGTSVFYNGSAVVIAGSIFIIISIMSALLWQSNKININ